MNDNRSGGPALGSTGASDDPHNGQVVFIAPIDSNSPSKQFAIRQLPPPTATVQGGLGHQINMTAIDGYWDGGVFQIVDKLVYLKVCFFTFTYPITQILGSSPQLHHDNQQMEPNWL